MVMGGRFSSCVCQGTLQLSGSIFVSADLEAHSSPVHREASIHSQDRLAGLGQRASFYRAVG